MYVYEILNVKYDDDDKYKWIYVVFISYSFG